MHAQMQSRRELFDVYVRDFHQMSGVKEKHLEELQAIDRILEAKARITALVAADLNRGLKSPAGARAKLTAERAIKRIGPETWQAINDALVQYAVEKKVESGAASGRAICSRSRPRSWPWSPAAG